MGDWKAPHKYIILCDSKRERARNCTIAENRKFLLTVETWRAPPGVFWTITRFIWILAREAMACLDAFA